MGLKLKRRRTTIPTLEKVLEHNKKKIASKVENGIGERNFSFKSFDEARPRRSTVFKISFNEVQVHTKQ